MIQTPNAGVVGQILVKEEQQVTLDQPLALMHPQSGEAAAGAPLADYAAAHLTLERLQAEQSGRRSLNLPAELVGYSNDSAVQAQLLIDRLRSRSAERAAIEESLSGLKQKKLR